MKKAKRKDNSRKRESPKVTAVKKDSQDRSLEVRKLKNRI